MNTGVISSATNGREGASESAKAIGVRVLLVSGDIQTIDTLCHFMEQMAIHLEVCSDMSPASRKLCHGKYEGIVVDFKDPAEALELIKKARGMTSHKGAVVLAILNSNNEMPDAFRAGANFTLVRPLLAPILKRTLSAAYPLMVRERRRYFRYPAQVPVCLSRGSHPEFVATSVNISESGMAIISPLPLQVGERVNLKLELPGMESTAILSGEVCWTDNEGRAGLVFVQVPATVVERLQSWIADRLEECLPR